MKPVHMQLLLFSSAFFFLLREIYSARMLTSEFNSMILLNKEFLHLISVDPILKFKIVWNKIECSAPCFQFICFMSLF